MKKYQVFKIQSESNLKIEIFFKKSKKELDKFFDIEVDLPKIFLLNSRREFNRYWGRKTKEWEVGRVENNFIFVLDPQKYTQESNHKNPDAFWKTIKHEHCHIYYRKIVGKSTPIWLNEGLAGYLSGQVQRKPEIDEAIKVVDLYNAKIDDTRKYKLGYFWVRFLLQKFGRKKFLRSLNLLKGKVAAEEFRKIFFKVYKIKFNKEELKNIIKSYERS